ncbi:MAG: ABC transporter ATP-binding protein [Deltaproteobacteria bacterium]|jgi:NitT/TauT family transport system ATP-binding protein|nr:ABC transporter ATP-binding protein [Deltaproteobacteria bacterium]MBT4527917.1 ABC transporter ATP-binding protein [Deltaproteobacteria bacterium]
MIDFISINNLTKSYQTESGEVTAIEDISFNVKRGEFITMAGPSGCGKSTLLHIIANLLEPSQGTVNIKHDRSEKNQLSELGLVFQKSILFPWCSVIDNILFPLELLGQKKGGRERAMKLIELAGIKGFEEKLPHELSGGMQQRASICRALIANPSLLLMDEPFSAVDALTRLKLTTDLQRIWEEEKITIIFVTHNIEEAVTLGDRVLVLTARPGRLVWEEKIDLPRPRGRKTAAIKEFQDHCGTIYEKLGF